MSTRFPAIAFLAALTVCAAVSTFAASPAASPAPPSEFTNPPAAVVWLDDLDLSLAAVGYGKTNKGRTTNDGELMVNGAKFDRGFGWHAPGSMVVTLPETGSARFRAQFGVADETNGQGRIAFHIYADGERVWSSGFVVGNQSAVACDLTFTGKKHFVLYADEGPEGYGDDHAVVGDARIELDEEGAKSADSVRIVRPALIDAEGGVVLQDSINSDEYEIVKEFASLKQQLAEGMREDVAATARDVQATLLDSDRDPLDIVARRTSALLDELGAMCDEGVLTEVEAAWAEFLERYEAASANVTKENAGTPEIAAARLALFAEACELRREIALKNPLLDFSDVVFIKRHYCPSAPSVEQVGNHMVDQFFGFHAAPGGGLFLLKNAFGEQPELVNILENSVVENGRLKGTKLDSTWGFLAPHLTYDGKQVYFAATDTKSPRHSYVWNEDNCYHIFRVNIDGTNLVQLTDGPYNDIDPCLLPNGRVVFISERRGGYGRCHARPCPSYTLHSMNPDGSDITVLSVHETNEWAPSVDKNGMIIYTRWDYVDRGSCQAHHPWTTFPDGRDARAIQGNYSEDKHTRPDFETSMKQVPDSNLLVGTACGHHTQNFGSIILVDPLVADDDVGDDPMAPIRRVTPEQLFPEAEIGVHGPPTNYGQPYPLSEDFFLVVYDAFSGSAKGHDNNFGIYLLDSFGNKILLYRDPDISCQHPIPLASRPVPPIIPHQTLVGIPEAQRDRFDAPEELPKTATVGLIDVYTTTRPFPEGAKIKELRVVQVLPKTTTHANVPWIGYGGDNSARKVLGTVPVEEDGSARFEAPVNVPFYMQALDENGVAVQTMRSATYVHPGETLTCLGCHEGRFNTSQNVDSVTPIAFTRPPSIIEPDVKGSNPFNYPTLVQTVLDRHCAECHEQGAKEGKTFELGRGPEDQYFLTSYINLRPYIYVTGNGNENPSAPVSEQPTTGWSWNLFTKAKTYPGEFGANASPLWKLLKEGHYDVQLSGEEMRAIALWLDCNCDFFGAYELDTLQAQRRGEVVLPTLE